jgi:hypothetical protein
MSTPDTEIKIDLDAKVDNDAPKVDKSNLRVDKQGAIAEPEPEIEVVEAAAPAKSDPKPVLKPEEGLEKLKKQLEDEKTARADAERRAAEAAESERQARTEKQGTELDLVVNAIATVTQANDQLEDKYASALQAGDFAGAAKINREMTANSAKLERLEAGKSALERAPKPTVRVPVDPVEKFTADLTPQSAAWVRAHPEYVRDPKKNAKMLAAHNLVVADDIAADSPEYFEAVERILGIKADPAPADPDPMADAARPSRKSAPAGAPVTRSGNGGGSRPNVVTLTAEEREIARMNGMTDREYAIARESLKKEGRLN